jgi:hypothetical protein
MSPYVPAVEVIVDSSKARFRGDWQTSSLQKRSYGPSYRVTDRTGFSVAPRTAQWRPILPGSGDYTVSVWLPDGGRDRSRAVKYRLFHAGSVTEFVVDQTKAGGEWKQLGRKPFRFENSGEEFLELRVADLAASPDGLPLYVQADAVRFASPPPAVVSAPVLASTAATCNYVEFRWNPLSQADSFIISRAAGSGPPKEIAEVADLAFLDLEVVGGREYTYSLAGTNGAGIGPSVSITVSTAKGPPLEPVRRVTIGSVGGVPRLAWQPTRDASSYVVQRSHRSGGPFVTVARVEYPSFLDFSAPSQAHYIVRSVNEYGQCELASWQVNWRRR